MHRNYRRKYKFRSKHHGIRPFPSVESLKTYKTIESRRCRARSNDLLRNGRFDDFVRIRVNLLGDYW